MGNCIHRAVIWLVRLIGPAPTGRHRSAHHPHTQTYRVPDTPTQPLPVIRCPNSGAAQRRTRNTEPLPAENVAAVRPYLLAHEQRVRDQNERLTSAVRGCLRQDLAEVFS